MDIDELLAAKNGKDATPLSKEAPGFFRPGFFGTNYEVSMGLERQELLHQLQGKKENFLEDYNPIVMTHKGTKENPIRVEGYDPVYYVGCSGFPQDSHELVWLTLKDHKGVDRCPICGNVFKYHQRELDHH
jgi:cytochrome c oxidase subunit 5b